MLLWELDREFKYRLWKQRRALAELDGLLAAARAREAGAQQARAAVPAGVDIDALRIAQLAPRIEALQSRIEDILGRQRERLQVLAARELEAQKTRLETYRMQARFALATVYDRASLAAEAGAGAAQ